jgi:hypothetical protein
LRPSHCAAASPIIETHATTARGRHRHPASTLLYIAGAVASRHISRDSCRCHYHHRCLVAGRRRRPPRPPPPAPLRPQPPLAAARARRRRRAPLAPPAIIATTTGSSNIARKSSIEGRVEEHLAPPTITS